MVDMTSFEATQIILISNYAEYGRQKRKFILRNHAKKEKLKLHIFRTAVIFLMLPHIFLPILLYGARAEFPIHMLSI